MPSLYADLLDPSLRDPNNPNAPIQYSFKKADEQKDEEKEKEKKPKDAALKFIPVKRPVPKKPTRPSIANNSTNKSDEHTNKKSPENTDVSSKPLPGAEAGTATPDGDEGTNHKASGEADEAIKSLDKSASDTAQVAPKEGASIDQFMPDEEDYDPFAEAYKQRMADAKKQQRGGRKNKKKKANGAGTVDWDAVYDPTRPSRLDQYEVSEERYNADHEWKTKLFAHRFARTPEEHSGADEPIALDESTTGKAVSVANRDYGQSEDLIDVTNEGPTLSSLPFEREDLGREPNTLVPSARNSSTTLVPEHAVSNQHVDGPPSSNERVPSALPLASQGQPLAPEPPSAKLHVQRARDSKQTSPPPPPPPALDVSRSEQPLGPHGSPFLWGTPLPPGFTSLKNHWPMPPPPPPPPSGDEAHGNNLNQDHNALTRAMQTADTMAGCYNHPGTAEPQDPRTALASVNDSQRGNPQNAADSSHSITISAPPVMYNQPVANLPSVESGQTEPSPSSPPLPLGRKPAPPKPVKYRNPANRHKQPWESKFAKRIMEKQGWKSGEGLGPTGAGITTPLYHDPIKQVKTQSGNPTVRTARIVGAPKRKKPSGMSKREGDVIDASVVMSSESATQSASGPEHDTSLPNSAAQNARAAHGTDAEYDDEEAALRGGLGLEFDSAPGSGAVEEQANEGDSTGGEEETKAHAHKKQKQTEKIPGVRDEWTRVVRIAGMFAGATDIRAKYQDVDFKQELGNRFSKCGNVENYNFEFENADFDVAGPVVRIMFTSELSAVRMFQYSDGKDFLGNGNVSTCNFFDEEMFNKGLSGSGWVQPP